MKKRRSQKRVHPRTIIASFKEVFKTIVVKKTSLRNLLLSVVAVSVSKTLRINEVASRLPIPVKNEKSKQKRFLRFLETAFPIDVAQQAWVRFVLRRLWKPTKTDKYPLILIDETDLHGGFKAIVGAVAFRKRAIPIFWWVYSNAEIQDMTYKSHNQLIQHFCLRTHQLASEVYPHRQQKPVLVFDRGFARAKYVIECLKEKDIPFVMRVCRNVSVLAEGNWQTLDDLSVGSHPNILYQQTHEIHCHLFVVRDAAFQDPMYLISNLHTGKQIHHCYKRRMRIEHAFRDIKSTFGFGKLVLKKTEKHRIELLFLIAIFAYGFCFLCYEKSADRWAKTLNTGKQKTYALISVIKRVITDQWSPQKLKTWFTPVASPAFSIT